MPLHIRYAAFAALALAFVVVPAMLYGQKSDPCAPAGGYEHATDNVSKVSDETTKASTTVLNDSSKTADAINKLKTSIFGSKKGTKTAAPAATPAPSTQSVMASLQKPTATSAGGAAKAPEAGKQPCPASASGNKLMEAKQTGPATPASPAPTPAPTAGKATVQDEGDGKHVVLTMPGEQDARELTIIPNTKNMYLEESTGDKFLITPEGSVTRIPHKVAQKAS